jgi:hypothetical protein
MAVTVEPTPISVIGPVCADGVPVFEVLVGYVVAHTPHKGSYFPTMFCSPELVLEEFRSLP